MMRMKTTRVTQTKKIFAQDPSDIYNRAHADGLTGGAGKPNLHWKLTAFASSSSPRLHFSSAAAAAAVVERYPMGLRCRTYYNEKTYILWSRFFLSIFFSTAVYRAQVKSFQMAPGAAERARIILGYRCI